MLDSPFFGMSMASSRMIRRQDENDLYRPDQVTVTLGSVNLIPLLAVRGTMARPVLLQSSQQNSFFIFLIHIDNGRSYRRPYTYAMSGEPLAASLTHSHRSSSCAFHNGHH